MSQGEGIELLELLSALRDGVEELFPDRVWVRAEIASVQTRSNGHCYLELSQSDGRGVVARARAVIWRSRYLPLATYFKEAAGGSLQAGIAVLVRAAVNYSEIYGLTLDIDEIEPAFTLGEAEIRRRRTIEELEKAGLMDMQKGLRMAALPYSLALVSAPDAAGLGDFRKHLSENEYGFAFRLRLFEAVMQGEGAPASVADALERIESSGDGYDAVLILRGGGSALDLSCFDDFGMCLAIASCPIPVFTAIGHERDSHVADMVAFRSVKTPTALADEFIDAVAAEDERLSSFASRLALAFASRIAAMESRLDILQERIRRGDPRSVLERGYTLVAGPDSRVVKSAASLREGDLVRILFADGSIAARIEKIDK